MASQPGRRGLALTSAAEGGSAAPSLEDGLDVIEIAEQERAALPPGLWWLGCRPFVERLRVGEGALLAVNATWLAFARPGWRKALPLALLSTLVLATAYALNDWHDARGDLADPRKNRRLVRGLIDRRGSMATALAVAHLVLVGMAGLTMGFPSAAAVTAMLGINAAYSWRLKGVPFVDLVVVGLWGAAFVAIAGAPPSLCATVGLMTLIMHLFQIERDRHVDAANAISTTAVRFPNAASSALILACGLLAAALFPRLGPVGAASAAIPLGLYWWVRETGRAWMACRLYCGVVLLAAIGGFRGLG